MKFQGIIWHAGLRGAIAFDLAVNFPSENRSIVIFNFILKIIYTCFSTKIFYIVIYITGSCLYNDCDFIFYI